MLSLFELKILNKIIFESIRIIWIIKVSNPGVNLEKNPIFSSWIPKKDLKINFKIATNQPPNSY